MREACDNCAYEHKGSDSADPKAYFAKAFMDEAQPNDA